MVDTAFKITEGTGPDVAFSTGASSDYLQAVRVYFGADGQAAASAQPLTDTQLRATPVPVSGTIAISGTVAVTQSGAWSVTANAGTNLNTSALALEAGGNLAAIAASASVLDDWDETDRAKVNLIVGQAGVAGGTGADGATVLRVSLATNVALPAGTNNIGDVDVLTVPADPFGANADAAATAGSTGSMQAKFRLMTSQLDSIKTAAETIDNIVSGSGANVSQINGVTPLMGNGGTGTGALRVALVSDGTGRMATVDTVTAVTTVTTVTTLTNLTGGTTAHDSPGGSINPVAVGGYASAAAPSDVSADADIVRAWRLRNGAAACVLTAAGALIGGDASNGLDVDVTRLSSLVAGTAKIGSVKTRFVAAAASAMTRPGNTTAYAANDAVSNNATAGSVTAISFSVSDVNDDPISLERLRIASTDTGVQGKAFRAWFYRSDPTASSGVVGGDNAAFSTKQGTFIGAMSGIFRTFSDGSVAVLTPDEGARIITVPTSGALTVFALLQTLDAFTPSANSTTFTPTVEGFQGQA